MNISIVYSRHDDEKEKIGPAMPKSSSHIINIPHPPSMMDKRPPPPPAPRAPMPPKPPVSAPKPPPPGPMMNTNRMLPMSGQPPQRMMVLPPRPPMQPPPGMRGPHVMGKWISVNMYPENSYVRFVHLLVKQSLSDIYYICMYAPLLTAIVTCKIEIYTTQKVSKYT